MGDGGTGENQRRHPEGNDSLRVVYFVENQIVPGFHGLPEVTVDEAYRKAGQWQKGDEPTMRLTHRSNPFQRGQQGGRGRTRKHSNCCAEDRPARKVGRSVKKSWIFSLS